jgi:replicative DNA helicase
MTYKPKPRKKQKLPVEYGESLPPQNVEMEEAVLGAVMSEGKYIDKIMGEFNPNLFFNVNHKEICYAILQLYKLNTPIDLITLSNELKNRGSLDRVGGSFYLATLTSKMSSMANIEYYIRVLQQEALKRKVIELCSMSVTQAFDGKEDVFDVYQNLQKELDNSVKEVVKYSVAKIGDIHEKIVRESIEVAEHGGKSGVTSGLKMLDNVTNGWQKSDLIIIAGRPSMGKTASAISIIMKPAIQDKKAVAIFSLEMSKEQLVARMQSDLSEINVSRIVKKQVTLEEIDVIARKCVPLETANIYIDDTPSISLLELKGKARKLVKENNVELIVVDYLQLMKSGLNIQQREQEIAEISRGLKGLAKELDIPIIALSQLSRVVEGRADKKPLLSDLRESGQIEQDADMVMFCYRPEYYGIENYELDGNVFESYGLFLFIIAKHRNGELGEIPLKFIHAQTKITNHDFNTESEDTPTPRVEPTEEKPSMSMYEIGLKIISEENDNIEIPF